MRIRPGSPWANGWTFGNVNGLDQLTPAAVKSVHTVLRLILNRAVDLDYIPRNPALKYILPMQERKEIQPLDDGQAAALIRAAAGTRIEFMVPLALFTGMRLSELLGLTWDVVDMDRGTITVDKQLIPGAGKRGPKFTTPKSGKPRTITPAASAFDVLRRQRARQAEYQLRAGPVWSNPYGLVFTVEDGGPRSPCPWWRAFFQGFEPPLAWTVYASTIYGIRLRSIL